MSFNSSTCSPGSQYVHCLTDCYSQSRRRFQYLGNRIEGTAHSRRMMWYCVSNSVICSRSSWFGSVIVKVGVLNGCAGAFRKKSRPNCHEPSLQERLAHPVSSAVKRSPQLDHYGRRSSRLAMEAGWWLGVRNRLWLSDLQFMVQRSGAVIKSDTRVV